VRNSIVTIASGQSRGTRVPRGVALFMELVARFPLRPLRSERDLDRATKIVNELAVRGHLLQSVSFLGLFPPEANKTVSFFVSFHQGATQSGTLFLISIERGTSRRVYRRRPSI
jgi:hypothetical protein